MELELCIQIQTWKKFIRRTNCIGNNLTWTMMTNEKCRVIVKCKADDYIWRIHASPVVDKETYQIKSYEGRHTCIRTTKNYDANSTWIAKKLPRLLVVDPNISYLTMRQVL